jgi:hypothetical protein
MRKNQQGFSIVELLIVLIVIVLIVGVWMYVFDKQSKKDTSKTNENTTSQQANPDMGDKNIYKNDELGLTFIHPSKWGNAVTKTRGDSDRSVSSNGYTEYDITFPNVPLFILPIINNKSNYLIQHAGCFNSLGFLNFHKSQAPDELKPGDWEQSETSSGNNYTTYSKVLISDSKTIVIESFSISTIVNPQGYCNGLSVYGLQEVSSNSKNLSQVQFLWSKTASTFGKDQPKLNLKDLDEFKNNPTNYILDEDLADLQATIQSIKAY